MANQFILPPLARDFSGIASIANDIGIQLILYNPGGCDASLRKADEADKSLSLLKSRFDDLMLASGTDDILASSILNTRSLEGKTVLLLGTSLTEMVGADYERIARELKDRLNLIPIRTDGFSSYKKGIQLFYKSPNLWQEGEIIRNKIQIIGHSRLALGERKILEPILQILEENSYEVEFLADKGFILDGEIQWILTPEGESIKNLEGVKRIFGLPIGNFGLRRILGELGIDFPTTRQKNISRKEKVLIVGEYASSIGLAQSLKNDFNFKAVEIGILKDEFQTISRDSSISPDCKLHKIEDLNLLNRLIEESHIIIADPLIDKTFDLEGRIFIPIPYRGLSGRYFSSMDYELVGEAGIDYIKKYI